MIFLKICVLLLFIDFGFGYIIRIGDSDEEIVDGWHLYLRGAYSKNLYVCEGIFIHGQIFLTDPYCIHSIIKQYAINEVFISNSPDKSSTRIPVDLKANLYYNENLSNGYDESRRQTVFIVTKEQIVINHDHEEFIELPKNVKDVDFSSCFLREHGKYVASVSPCSVEDHNNVIICSYNSHVSVGALVICRLKDHPMTLVLVGISSQHKFLKNNGTKSSIELENYWSVVTAL
ncbi:Protein of unknown function [Cotesia congregata]|uniref:Peptidase S1 domain-containing protein n=1 Tax=Cotesia congregata TaxID=51543 RepID=A0A8J2H9A0_COTCN|nr:Protein of unknown function [Cotesia congregata]